MEPKLLAVLDHPLVTDALFYPRRLREAEVPSDPHGRVLAIPVGTDRLGGYLYRPRPEGPVILFFHGNGEVMTDYLEGFHLEIAKLCANLLVVDYRGYGLSSGSPSLSRLLEDARAAWAYATGKLGLKPTEIVVMGRSLGSLAALELAGGPGREALGLVLESGIARFDQWVARMAPFLERQGLDVELLQRALRTAFDNEAKLKAYPGPVLVMHAPDDEIVPVSHGRELASWSPNAKLRVFARGGHNDIMYINHAQYFTELGRFLAKVTNP